MFLIKWSWIPTRPTATRPLAIQKDGSWFTYGHDITKNVWEVFGPSGYVRTSYDYAPFGAVTASGDVTQPFQWSSEFYDSELGLVYYNYRHYSPTDGRWLSRDPIEEQGGLNLYAFVGNLPVYITDGLGEEMSENSCNNIIAKAKTSNLRIRKTIEAIKNKKGCKEPEISCECCTGSLEDAGGYYLDSKVKICRNTSSSGNEVLSVLLHELIHAWNDCNGDGAKDCESSICDEISAYLNSGQCQQGGLWRRLEDRSTKDCVVRGVLFSSKYFCPSLSEEGLKKKINEMYGKCNQQKMPF